LNTWRDSSVQGWSAATSLEAVLNTIRSMIHNNPISEEPGHTKKTLNNKDASNYHIAATYAALDNTFNYFLKGYKFSDEFLEKMSLYFNDNKEVYKNTIKNLEKDNGKTITYLHGNVTIDTTYLKKRLKEVNAKIK
jgi:hypothetical protein